MLHWDLTFCPQKTPKHPRPSELAPKMMDFKAWSPVFLLSKAHCVLALAPQHTDMRVVSVFFSIEFSARK